MPVPIPYHPDLAAQANNDRLLELHRAFKAWEYITDDMAEAADFRDSIRVIEGELAERGF